VHPVYGDKCFARPAIHVYCKMFKKMLLIKNDVAAFLQRLQQSVFSELNEERSKCEFG